MCNIQEKIFTLFQRNGKFIIGVTLQGGIVLLKASVGYSTLDNAVNAGKEIATNALSGLKAGTIGFLFTSVDYNQEKVLSGIRAVTKNMPIIGCTSSKAIIVPDGIINSENGFGGMLVIDDPDLEVGVACLSKDKDLREVGRKATLEALKNANKDYAPNYYMMISNIEDEEEYIKGIQDVIGDIPMFGGSAADNTIEGKWNILSKDKVINNGVAIALFYTSKPIETIFTSEYEETDNVGVISKVVGKHILSEIDGDPAIDKYVEWTDKKESDLKGNKLLRESVLRPFGVKDVLGDITLIRHPLFGNDDGTVKVSNQIIKNTAIIGMSISVDNLIKSTGTTIEKVKAKLNSPGAYILMHSVGRKIAIADRLDEVHTNLVKASNGVPFIMPLTFSEYGYSNHSGSRCGSLMLSFTGFEK